MLNECRVPHLCQNGNALGMKLSMKLGKDPDLSCEDRRCVHSCVSIPALTEYFKGDPAVRDDRIPLVWFLGLHQST